MTEYLPRILPFHFIKALDETGGNTVHLLWDARGIGLRGLDLVKMQSFINKAFSILEKQQQNHLHKLPCMKTVYEGRPGKTLQWRRGLPPLQTHGQGSFCHIREY